jgi:hypothetical protein
MSPRSIGDGGEAVLMRAALKLVMVAVVFFSLAWPALTGTHIGVSAAAVIHECGRTRVAVATTFACALLLSAIFDRRLRVAGGIVFALVNIIAAWVMSFNAWPIAAIYLSLALGGVSLAATGWRARE